MTHDRASQIQLELFQSLKKKLSEEKDPDKRDMYQRMLTKVNAAVETASAVVGGLSTEDGTARRVTLSSFFLCICICVTGDIVCN